MKKLLLISLLIIGCNNNTNTNQSEELTLSAEEYIEIGDSLFLEERKYAPAIREYNKAIKLDPNRWGVYIDRGYAKYLLDDFKGAEADYTYVINNFVNLGDNWFLEEAYSERGMLREELGNMKGACQDWKKGAELGDELAAEWYDESCY